MKKDNRGGKRLGAGRKAGVSIKPDNEKKTYKFLGYKYTKNEYDILKNIFEKYKKENNLNTTEAIKRLVLEKK